METVAIAETFSSYRLDCPNCGDTFWLTQTQYDHPKFFIACDCGKDLKPNRPTKAAQQYKITDTITEVIDTLVVSGYSKREAIEKISRISNKNRSFEELFKEAVSL